MSQKIFSLAFCAMLLGPCAPAAARQFGKVPRLGVLLPWSPAAGVSLSFLKAFHDGLHELDYVRSQNVAIEYRYAEGMSERFPNLAAELVRLKVGVIVTLLGHHLLLQSKQPPLFPLSLLRFLTLF